MSNKFNNSQFLTSILAATALAFFALSACTSGGDTQDDDVPVEGTAQDNGNDEIAGVSRDSRISELSPDEQDAFCTYLSQTLEEMFSSDDFVESMCLTMSATFAGFAGEDPDVQVAACEQNYQECIAEDDEFENLDYREFCPDAAERATCDATMEEVHACFTEMVAIQKEEAVRISQYSCEELIKEGKLDEIQNDEADEPEACQILEEKCSILS